MPRKKLPPKFKYTARKGEVLYVRYPLEGENYPVWAKCEIETQEEVSRIIAEIKLSHAEAKAKKLRPKTLTEFFAEWLEAIRPTLADRTYSDYSEIFDRYAADWIGETLLSEIAPLSIQKLYNDLHKRVDASIVKKVHVLLMSAFSQAVKWKMLAENPAADLVLPRVTEKESPAMTQAEARAFAAACVSDLKYVVLEFALETGLRPEEYLALDWKNVNLDKRRAFVRRAIHFARSGGGYAFKETKTKNSRRTVSFSETLRKRLLELKRAQEKIKDGLRKRIIELETPVRAKFTPRRAKNKGANKRKRETLLKNTIEKLSDFETLNLVFPASHGKPWSLGNLGRREFKDVLKKAGLDTKKYYLYSLRHTNASLLAEKIKPKELQIWLGHAAISTTFKYYVHITDESHDETSNVLADMLY